MLIQIFNNELDLDQIIEEFRREIDDSFFRARPDVLYLGNQESLNDFMKKAIFKYKVQKL